MRRKLCEENLEKEKENNAILKKRNRELASKFVRKAIKTTQSNATAVKKTYSQSYRRKQKRVLLDFVKEKFAMLEEEGRVQTLQIGSM